MPEPTPPVTLPRALARYERWMFVCGLALLPLMAAFVLLALLWPAGTLAWSTLAVAALAAGALQLLAFWIITRARRRVIRRAMEADGLLCTACLYPLQPDSPRCPECGQHTSAHQCRLVWMECR